MKPLGIGIIGYGGFGRFLHQAWNAEPGYRVVAVADDRTTVHGHADLHIYEDGRGLLDDPSVDIVSIATPPDSHEVLALQAIAAGKHVLVDKPLATTLEAGRRIADAARQRGAVASVNFMMRFNPIVESLVELQRSGAVGPLRRFLVENYAQDESLGPDHWFWDRSRSGGILIEHAVHFVDIANRLSRGEALRVHGQAARRDDGRVDRMGLGVVYGDGLVMSQYHAFSRPNFFERTRMRFVFDLAEIDVEGWIPMEGRVDALASRETAEVLQRVLPHAEMLKDEAINADRDAAMSLTSLVGVTKANRVLHSGGIGYEVDRRLEMSFRVGTSKAEAYTAALRALMGDVVAAVRDRTHVLRVDMEDGLRSLAIAFAATRDALGEL